jgi:hypothetical protein
MHRSPESLVLSLETSWPALNTQDYKLNTNYEASNHCRSGNQAW